MESRKAFIVEVHSDKDPDNPKILIPRDPKVRVPKPIDVKMDSNLYFLPTEENTFLIEALHGVSYATYVTNDPALSKDVEYNGYVHTDGSRWHSFFSFWKGQEGRAFLIPEDSGIVDLSGVGIKSLIKALGEVTKTAKGINRLFSPLPANVEAVWGTEISYNLVDDISIIRLDLRGVDLTEEDKEISVRWVPFTGMTSEQKALADGTALVSEKGAKRLGLSVDPVTGEVKEPTIGMAWRFSAVGRAFAKGHIQFKPGMTVDLVLYGPKPYIASNRFFFGNMGALHVGDPHTDRQAFVNFGFHREGLALTRALEFMDEVWLKSTNELEFRHMFIRNSSEVKMEDMWLLQKCLVLGISFNRFPGLFSRVGRYFAGDDSKVFQCDNRARVPLGERIAFYGYVLVDLAVYDEEGNIFPERSLIKEGQLVFPDIKAGTQVVVYRQPSENSNAWYPLTITYNKAFAGYAGKGICLLGRGADKVLLRLGGGDLDDSFVIMHDKVWVNAFKTLRPYPETEKLSDDSPEEVDQYEGSIPNEFRKMGDFIIDDLNRLGTVAYSSSHLEWQIEMFADNKIGLGTAVNWGMLDMLLSDPDHRASMLADLEEQEEWEAMEWLTNYKPYQAAKVMTNLEIVIDGTVKDPTLLRKLAKELDRIPDWFNDCKVFPKCMGTEGKNSKIPASKKPGTYVLARSLMCRAIDAMEAKRLRLLNKLREHEWNIVAPADKVLLNRYPRDPAVVRLVGGDYRAVMVDGVKVMTRMDPDKENLREQWARMWNEQIALGVKLDIAHEYIWKTIAKKLERASDDLMEAIAVQLYFKIYGNKLRPTPLRDTRTGDIRRFPDGLLWSPVFAEHFIKALIRAGVTGFYKPVDLLPEWRRRVLNKTQLTVKLSTGGRVHAKDREGNFTVLIGVVYGNFRQGIFTMYSGMVEFERPQPICLPYNQ